jgi:hypothetical protein
MSNTHDVSGVDSVLPFRSFVIIILVDISTTYFSKLLTVLWIEPGSSQYKICKVFNLVEYNVV